VCSLEVWLETDILLLFLYMAETLFSEDINIPAGRCSYTCRTIFTYLPECKSIFV